jgi:hypothetical protein
VVSDYWVARGEIDLLIVHHTSSCQIGEIGAVWLQFVDRILQGLCVVNFYFEVFGWRLIDLNRDACGCEQLPILSQIRSRELGIEDNKKRKSAGEQIARPLDRWRKATVLIAIPRVLELYIARSAMIKKKYDFRSLLRVPDRGDRLRLGERVARVLGSRRQRPSPAWIGGLA